MAWSKRLGTLIGSGITVTISVLAFTRRRRKAASSKTRKQLWILDQYAVPPDLTGFTRQYEHASLLSRDGWETTVFATPFEHKRRAMERPVAARRPRLERSEQGVPFVWLYTLPYTGNDWRRYLNMASFLVGSVAVGAFRRSPDVILASSPHLLTGLAGWLLAKWHRVPFVLEIRDLWPESLVQLGLSNPFVIKPLAFLEQFLYGRANMVMYLTEGVGDGIRSKGVPETKLLFLPNASMRPEPLDSERRHRIRQQLGWQDDVVAIYAGAHGTANALEKVVEAAAAIPATSNVRIVLLGDGPSKAGLVEQASGLRTISFMDSVPKSEVSRILRAADIGILSLRQTQLFEGARPNKLFDYMANGLPVISTVSGETERVLVEAKAGICVLPDNFSDGLLELAQDPQMRSEMGKSGFVYVSSTQTREQMAAVLAVHLDEVVHEWANSKDGN